MASGVPQRIRYESKRWSVDWIMMFWQNTHDTIISDLCHSSVVARSHNKVSQREHICHTPLKYIDPSRNGIIIFSRMWGARNRVTYRTVSAISRWPLPNWSKSPRSVDISRLVHLDAIVSSCVGKKKKKSEHPTRRGSKTGTDEKATLLDFSATPRCSSSLVDLFSIGACPAEMGSSSGELFAFAKQSGPHDPHPRANTRTIRHDITKASTRRTASFFLYTRLLLVVSFNSKISRFRLASVFPAGAIHLEKPTRSIAAINRTSLRVYDRSG